MAEAVKEKKPRGTKTKPKLLKAQKPSTSIADSSAGPAPKENTPLPPSPLARHTDNASVTPTPVLPIDRTDPSKASPSATEWPESAATHSGHSVAEGSSEKNHGVKDSDLPSSVVEDSAFPDTLLSTHASEGAGIEVEALATSLQVNVNLQENVRQQENVGFGNRTVPSESGVHPQDHGDVQLSAAHLENVQEQNVLGHFREETISHTESVIPPHVEGFTQSGQEPIVAEETHRLHEHETKSAVSVIPGPLYPGAMLTAILQEQSVAKPTSPEVLVSRGAQPKFVTSAVTVDAFIPERLEIEELLAPAVSSAPLLITEATAPEPSLESVEHGETQMAQTETFRPFSPQVQPPQQLEAQASHRDPLGHVVPNVEPSGPFLESSIQSSTQATHIEPPKQHLPHTEHFQSPPEFSQSVTRTVNVEAPRHIPPQVHSAKIEPPRHLPIQAQSIVRHHTPHPKVAASKPAELSPSQTAAGVKVLDLKPMSVEQWEKLYYNRELQNNTQFIDNFIQKEERKTSHEFHEIVMNYHRSRKSLLSVEEDLKSLRQNYEQVQNELWVIANKTVTVEGHCADGSKVSKVHSYEQCSLNKDAVANLTSTLQSIRNEMQGDLALFAYSSQMSRLQVESYLHQLFIGCPHLSCIPRNAPVTATEYTGEDVLREVEKLKECISVLFAFHRRPTLDSEFVDNTRKWTERLVSALLRVANYGDHLFILNHVLRAPAGVGRWAASFIQIPPPITLPLQSTFGSPVLDHAVTCLATIMLPVKAREGFMCQMRLNVSENSLQMERAWILVDSDGEEDEDPSQAWLYLHENDIVSILQQFPMDAVFCHLLQAPTDEHGTVKYDVGRYTEPTMYKLFGFCTIWISLLGAGLNTYSMARYRQLNKRLGRLIRQTIAFVSDHWLNFKTYYKELAAATPLEQLQMEFDQLFMRATYTILGAQKLGSWQFMADMPFTCLSAQSVWQLLWLLQQDLSRSLNLDTLPPYETCKAEMTDLGSSGQLADTLQKLPTSESIYLLTTFANMAAARPLEENEFIECITLQIFEIAYICDHTRDFCSKTGRELLSSVIQKHPTAFSMLLRRVKDVMPKLGMMSLYLFHGLPASIWIPQDPDMVLLRQWLLNHDLASAESQLARVVLDRMNWDVFVETGKLVLDIRLHRQVASLLFEAYEKFIPERRASYFIVEGMRQMASYVSQQSSREQQFSNWVWSLALRLKLHRESAIIHSKAAESQAFSPLHLDERDPILLPMLLAAEAKHPLACFLVPSMSVYGHELTYIMGGGLNMLMSLAASSQFSAVIHILGCITPHCLEKPNYLLESETFQKILQMVLAADENILRVTKMVLGAEFPGTVTRQFTQMLQAMISSRLGCEAALPVLLFWMRAVFRVSRFLTDQNCCYVLDNLVRWGYLLKGARGKLDETFREYLKQLLTESHSKSSGGGLLSLFGSGASSQPSLMERASQPEFGWLASQILAVEETLEMESGVWPSLQHDLLANPNLAVETALKTISTRLKPEWVPAVGRLSIYRWAQQALEMPVDHPMLPVVWQRFFSLYLGRPTVNTQLPARASVGERFFQSTSMSSMLKRMKKRLSEAEKFHNKAKDEANQKSAGSSADEASSPPVASAPRDGGDLDTPLPSPTEEENQKYVASEEFHQLLASLYRTYILWLEEPRLHGADLYLPALPPLYNAARLMHIFVVGNSPWLEFVDFEGVQYDISLFAAQWRKMLSCRPQHGATSSPAHQRNAFRTGERSGKERILQRLQRYTSPQPAPSLHPVAPPVPDIATALLLDKAAILHLLNADLSVLTEFTKVFSTRAAQQCAIDAAYLDLIPKQYSNNQKQITVATECRSRVNPLHRCAGPAAIPVRIEERTVNLIVQRKMDENRAEYKQLVIEAVLPPPQNICIAAVHVENAITLLIKMAQTMTDPGRRSNLLDLSCTLFYHLTMQVNEETNFYPPTKQFFASCVEILGQEFVSRAPDQAPLLLQFCLDNPSLAGIVSPHFVPNTAAQNFVTMYEQLITVLQQQDLHLVFMLLTKFDVWAWLEECRPQMTDKKRFLEVLGSALMSCGAEPTAQSKLVFDLYLAHLRCMLRHQFPANLSSVLIMLLQGSGAEDLHTSCWEMLLMVCCCPPTGPESRPAAHQFNAERVETCNDIPLSTKDLQDMQGWLGAWFMHQRATDKDMASFGLYRRWNRYVPYISLLMGLLSRSFVAKVLKSMREDDPFEALKMVWQQQLYLWRAWLEPLPANAGNINPLEGPEMFEPWTEGYGTTAVTIVETFRTTLMFTHMTLANMAPQFSSTVFSLLLMHYMMKLSHRLTPPHITDVLVAEFSQLPWACLKPDLQLLETMAQMKERCAAPCFQLVGHVMTKVGWLHVQDYYLSHPEPQLASRQQGALLLLLVQCFGDKTVKEMPEILQVLTVAENFNWSRMLVEMYRKAVLWFLQVCQPQTLLAPRTSLYGLGLRLMKSAAEFTQGSSVAWRPDMSVKRRVYVHCMTQQLCQMTYLPNMERRDVEIALMNFLAEIEIVESAVVDVRCQEEESLDLMKEVLGLLNNSNPDGDWQTSILRTLQDWLKSSNSVLLLPGVKAASHCLASLSQMAIVTESCIEGYFILSMRELKEQARRQEAEPTALTDPAPHTYPTLPADPSPSGPLFPDGSPPRTFSAPIKLETPLVAEKGWTPILASLQLPELNLKEYVNEALNCGAYLTLHALILHKRSLCQAQHDESRLMEEILDWSSHAQPSTNEEAKMLLWWYEFLDMWLHQINCGASIPLAVNTIQRLVIELHQFGEDRATTGFLSVIGFGRKSALSTEFRLAVRTLAAFLSSQVLSETSIRFEPNAPLSDNPMAKQCRQALTGLRTNRAYADLKDDVQSLCSFVLGSENTARNSLDLVKELAQRLFSESSHLFDPLGWVREGLKGGKGDV